MDGRGTSNAYDVKQRALKVTWSTRDPDDRPTEEELIQAFTPYGTVVRVGIKVCVEQSMVVMKTTLNTLAVGTADGITIVWSRC